jgi:hypothetical protein
MSARRREQAKHSQPFLARPVPWDPEDQAMGRPAAILQQPTWLAIRNSVDGLPGHLEDPHRVPTPILAANVDRVERWVEGHPCPLQNQPLESEPSRRRADTSPAFLPHLPSLQMGFCNAGNHIDTNA